MNILILDATTKSIEILLAGSVTTNQLQCSTHFADANASGFTEGSDDDLTNNTTAVTIVAAPAASTRRIVREIIVYNNDTVAQTITVRLNSNGNYRIIYKGSLAAGATWTFSGSGAGAGISSVSWGDIIGTLADQTDLQALLDLKATIANVGGAGGWIPLSATLTYSSADDPTYIISSNADLTSIITFGNKIKFTNNSTTFYGKIVAIGSWSGSAQLITLNGGTDYDVANSAITAAYYSLADSPQGFPTSILKWRLSVTDTQNKQKASPNLNDWYGAAAANPWSTGSEVYIDIHPGVWRLCGSFYQYVLNASATIVTMETTISSINNDESDVELTAGIGGNGASSTMTVRQTSRVEKIITVTSKTRFYLLSRTETTGMDEINVIGATRAIIITADLVL